MDKAAVNRKVIEQFRSGGEIDGMHREMLLLLTTVGAKTGRPRTTPMMHLQDGGRELVVASNDGAPEDPNWYRNLVADAAVTVEVGDERYDAVARALEGAERAEAWATITRLFPFFNDHEREAKRQIPVVALVRRG
jgi:deazaflavin-dependent oxidoreductase (nitroreductase family)